MTTPSSPASRTSTTVLYLTTPESNPVASPLSYTYHSPSTRHLSTLLPTTPIPSTITEVDTAYCPQCFTSWDANSAFHVASGCCCSTTATSSSSTSKNSNNSGGYGCISCPICESGLTLSVQEASLYKLLLSLQIRQIKKNKDDGDDDDDNDNDDSNNDNECTHVCIYKCGYCQWDSTECNIYTTCSIHTSANSTIALIQEQENKEKEVIEKASQELKIILYNTIQKQKMETNKVVDTLIEKWNDKLKSQEMNRRKMDLIVSRRPIIGGGGVVGGGVTKTANTTIDTDNRGSKSTNIANTCSILHTSSKDPNIIKRRNKYESGTETQTADEPWSIETLENTTIKKKEHIMDQVFHPLLNGNINSKNNTKSNEEEKEKEGNRHYLLKISRLSIQSDAATKSSRKSNNNDKMNKSSTSIITPIQSMKQSTITSKSTSMSNENKIQATSSSSQLLLPTPIKLRTRAVRRDYKELSIGRPGIVIKPKVNPLEGDSSLRYGHGQWWKKDSSAIHTVPKLTIPKYTYNRSTSEYALLLHISNPTLGPMTLKLHTSFSMLDTNSSEDTTSAKPTKKSNKVSTMNSSTALPNLISSIPKSYPNIILDPIHNYKSKVNVGVIPPRCNQCETKMNSFSLESMEDAYLELGGLSAASGVGGGSTTSIKTAGSGNMNSNTKYIVDRWEDEIVWSNAAPMTTTTSSKNTKNIEVDGEKKKEDKTTATTKCNFKLLQKDNDSAFILFQVSDDSNRISKTNTNVSTSRTDDAQSKHDEHSYSDYEFLSCPIVMEIDVGNGSWESSLIQPKASSKEGEKDSVSFVVLPVWKVHE